MVQFACPHCSRYIQEREMNNHLREHSEAFLKRRRVNPPSPGEGPSTAPLQERHAAEQLEVAEEELDGQEFMVKQVEIGEEQEVFEEEEAEMMEVEEEEEQGQRTDDIFVSLQNTKNTVETPVLFDFRSGEPDTQTYQVSKSVEFYTMMMKQRATKQLVDNTIGFFNKYLTENNQEHLQLLSQYKTKKVIDKYMSDIGDEAFDVCINGCMMFNAAIEATTTICHHCKEPRFGNDGKPRATHRQVPIAGQLAKFLSFKKNADMINTYRTLVRNNAEDGVYSDMFDGEIFRNEADRVSRTESIDINFTA